MGSLTLAHFVKRKVAFREIVAFAFETFSTNKVRFVLTALGMVIGTASLILVTTIGLTGKRYVMNQIQAIGVNLIFAEYGGGAPRITNVNPDPLTIDDMNAVLSQVPEIVAASPVSPLDARVPVGYGQERDIRVLGVYPEYAKVRNLIIVAGRFFDQQDLQAHNKVGVITSKLAQEVFGAPEEAIGQVFKLSGLPFTIIGTFTERVDTFGQSEVTNNTMLMPYSVARNFEETPTVKQIYFSTSDSSNVSSVTTQIRDVIRSRHRAESVYSVGNLTQLVIVANRTANVLTLTLLAIALIVLLVSGIGIMNIMLATVNSRIREIGIRKAIGATTKEIRFQFLFEAVLISTVGGILGTLTGLALPLSVRFLTAYQLPISGVSVIIAIVVSSLVGIIFGTVPATRAARMEPVESLRHE